MCRPQSMVFVHWHTGVPIMVCVYWVERHCWSALSASDSAQYEKSYDSDEWLLNPRVQMFVLAPESWAKICEWIDCFNIRQCSWQVLAPHTHEAYRGSSKLSWSAKSFSNVMNMIHQWSNFAASACRTDGFIPRPFTSYSSSYSGALYKFWASLRVRLNTIWNATEHGWPKSLYPKKLDYYEIDDMIRDLSDRWR